MRIWQVAAMGLLALAAPAGAQVQTVDPNAAAQADVPLQPGERGYAVEQQAPEQGAQPTELPDPAPPQANAATPAAPAPNASYKKDDVIGAAEGVFGKGAKGLAELLEKVLKDQGEPVGYIAGREASGAFVVGVRYGSGTLSHKIEGERPVYWTGPSVGFDVGGDATKVFTLVYNLQDSQELYRRYPQVEGRAYFVGGFSATYLRRGDVVLIPVRAGVGMRLGANVGYMRFSQKSRILPF